MRTFLVVVVVVVAVADNGVQGHVSCKGATATDRPTGGPTIPPNEEDSNACYGDKIWVFRHESRTTDRTPTSYDCRSCAKSVAVAAAAAPQTIALWGVMKLGLVR